MDQNSDPLSIFRYNTRIFRVFIPTEKLGYSLAYIFRDRHFGF